MNYYIYKNGVKDGPYSKEELKLVMIYPKTLIWRQGDDAWKDAKDIPDLHGIIIPEPSLTRQEKSNFNKTQDYSNLNYRNAGVITLVYLFLIVILAQQIYESIIGTIVIAVLPFIIWGRFKGFLKRIGEGAIARSINLIFIPYFIFWPVFLFTMLQNWRYLAGKSLIEIFFGLIGEAVNPQYSAELSDTTRFISATHVLLLSFILIAVCVWIPGIKLLKIDRQYSFPFKRIAISSMICIPLYMSYFWISVITNDSPYGLFPSFILSLPYLFLAIHFFNADKSTRYGLN